VNRRARGAAPQPTPSYTGSPINRGIGRPARPSRYGGRRGLLTLAVVVLALGVFGWVGLHDNADANGAPGVGSCVRFQGDAGHTTLRTLDCADPLARYDVLAKIVGGDDASCLAVPGAINWYAVSEVDPALHTQHPAYVLCLGPN
jgi:hypothetical protein